MPTHPAPPPDRRWDAVVAGGGPAGATAALCLARAGRRVLLVERERFPRFHVGESLLPANRGLLAELDLLDRVASLPHQPKYGAEFAFGHETDAETLRFAFAEGLLDADDETFNVERGPFDAMLLAAAAEAGADVVQGAAVRRVVRLGEGEAVVEVAASGGAGGFPARRVAARCLVDASGQSTLLGKRLGLRRAVPGHSKVACFGHFRGVERLAGRAAGHPFIVMMADAWFWLIALDGERTSIGVVMDRDAARRVQSDFGLEPHQLLAWAIERCPLVARRTAAADFPGQTHVAADFSYRCVPYAGPGWFAVGDAAAFLDPIFSTGICLGMVGGREAARRLDAILAGGDPVRQRAAYRRLVETGSAPLFRLVHRFYRHEFRELMMQGEGPLGVHRALFSLLAGQVFPRPRWRLRWRQRLLELFTEIQARWPLVPRHERVWLHPPDGAETSAGAAKRDRADGRRFEATG